jgi:hypothetical protein
VGKIKIIFIIIIAFIIYKGVVAFKNFEIGVSNKVAEIEELADFEKEEEVIGLMMYLGNPLELKEHLFTESRSKCLKLKKIAEETSFAYYECAKEVSSAIFLSFKHFDLDSVKRCSFNSSGLPKYIIRPITSSSFSKSANSSISATLLLTPISKFLNATTPL